MLSKDKIDEINSKCPSDQGVFMQPYGIPVDIKELVVYTRYKTGGTRGYSYHDDSENEEYATPEPANKWEVLDIVLEELCPNISYLQYRKIIKLMHDNDETENEYYGNSTEWKVEYIILSELLDKINEFKKSF